MLSHFKAWLWLSLCQNRKQPIILNRRLSAGINNQNTRAVIQLLWYNQGRESIRIYRFKISRIDLIPWFNFDSDFDYRDRNLKMQINLFALTTSFKECINMSLRNHRQTLSYIGFSRRNFFPCLFQKVKEAQTAVHLGWRHRTEQHSNAPNSFYVVFESAPISFCRHSSFICYLKEWINLTETPP